MPVAPRGSARVLCGLLVGLAAVLAGCASSHRSTGAGSRPTTPATLTSTARTASSVSATTPALTATSTAATTSSLLTPATDTGPESFQLPSGNIGCFLATQQVRCDIRDRQWSPPPRPANCPLDFGQGIELTANGPTFVCAGDTALGGPDKLGYGQAARRGPFVCNSSTAGITCRDIQTGRGFSLEREGYRIF